MGTTYVLDLFRTADGAFVSPRTCTPGPGTLVVTRNPSISGNALLQDNVSGNQQVSLTPAAPMGLVAGLWARIDYVLPLAGATAINMLQLRGLTTSNFYTILGYDTTTRTISDSVSMFAQSKSDGAGPWPFYNAGTAQYNVGIYIRSVTPSGSDVIAEIEVWVQCLGSGLLGEPGSPRWHHLWTTKQTITGNENVSVSATLLTGATQSLITYCELSVGQFDPAATSYSRTVVAGTTNNSATLYSFYRAVCTVAPSKILDFVQQDVGAGGAGGTEAFAESFSIKLYTHSNSNWTSWSEVLSNGVSLFPLTYVFTVSGITTPPAIGAIYTNNGQSFVVLSTNITGNAGTITCGELSVAVAVDPTGSTLTKSSGTGDAAITFSAFVGYNYAMIAATAVGNTIVAVSTRFNRAATPNDCDVMVRVSADGGVTWSPAFSVAHDGSTGSAGTYNLRSPLKITQTVSGRWVFPYRLAGTNQLCLAYSDTPVPSAAANWSTIALGTGALSISEPLIMRCTNGELLVLARQGSAADFYVRYAFVDATQTPPALLSSGICNGQSGAPLIAEPGSGDPRGCLAIPAFGKMWMLGSDPCVARQRQSCMVYTLDDLGNPTLHIRSPLVNQSSTSYWGEAPDMDRLGGMGVVVALASGRQTNQLYIRPDFFANEALSFAAGPIGTDRGPRLGAGSLHR